MVWVSLSPPHLRLSDDGFFFFCFFSCCVGHDHETRKAGPKAGDVGRRGGERQTDGRDCAFLVFLLASSVQLREKTGVSTITSGCASSNLERHRQRGNTGGWELEDNGSKIKVYKTLALRVLALERGCVWSSGAT